MRVEQLGLLFERERAGSVELYWVDPNEERWQIYGHGMGKEELIPQKVFWIPNEAKPVHHADQHLKKILKKIRFHDWVKETLGPTPFFQQGRTVISVNQMGQVWQNPVQGFGLQRLFWLPENAVSVSL